MQTPRILISLGNDLNEINHGTGPIPLEVPPLQCSTRQTQPELLLFAFQLKKEDRRIENLIPLIYFPIRSKAHRAVSAKHRNPGEHAQANES